VSDMFTLANVVISVKAPIELGDKSSEEMATRVEELSNEFTARLRDELGPTFVIENRT
jgi:hypothetical protein